MTIVPTLTDGTVTLRALAERDVPGCYEQCIDEESVRWTTVPTPFSPGMAREYCLEIAPGAWADGSQSIFAVEAAGTGPGGYAGNIALRDAGHGRAEVAFGAHPAARGTGVMERAVRLLIAWGFATQGVQTVIWRANVGNWTSRKLAWRLGFDTVGVLRGTQYFRGDLVDVWFGTLLSGEPMEPRHRWLSAPTLDADDGTVRLRPLTDDDVPRIVEACSDERTQHWLGSMPADYTDDDARAWLDLNREGQATGAKVTWAVADPDTDLLLAAINLFDVSADSCEVGYWAHPDARGRGVVRAAVRAAIGWGFTDLGVQRVRALAALENTASRHVIESSGMTLGGIERRGTLLRTGRADVALYDVLASEWR